MRILGGINLANLRVGSRFFSFKIVHSAVVIGGKFSRVLAEENR